MIILKDSYPAMQKIINAISVSHQIEVAVFNSQCELIVCTQRYLENKGRVVHTPSIEEVLSFGNVIVNEPGRMPTCLGCRFKDKCPSTIELLSCIKINNDAMGVVCLTSFTQEGHHRILKNAAVYSELLQEICALLSGVLLQQYGEAHFQYYEQMLRATLDYIKEPMLIVDGKGMMRYCNEAALKLFSFCQLSIASLHTLFASHRMLELLDEGPVSDFPVMTPHFSAKLSGTPLHETDLIKGAIIKFSNVRLHDDAAQKNNKTMDQGLFYLSTIVGKSKCMKLLKERVLRFSQGQSTILLTGETGTGKEMFAKAIHYNSARRDHPFVSINCASIPEALLESELFGYDEGAFTGAKRGGKQGRFELAQNGTLFLDEIGEMPMNLQAKLLRVLQDYTIERVGSVRGIHLDIRVIAATHQNLEECVANGTFRADLYYRLNVIPLALPPLRERLNDLPLLANHFLEKYNKKLNKNILGIDEGAMDLLSHHQWPGNVRELENAIEYAVNMALTATISQSDLPERLHRHINKAECANLLKETEADLIEALLHKHGRDLAGKQAVADVLGISLRTLYRKCQQ